MSAQSWAEEAERIARTAEQAINSLLHENRAAEAKLALADAQRDLRDVKRHLCDEQRDLRDRFADARLKTSGVGQMTSMLAGSKTRMVVSRARSAQKRSIARDQADALRPYADVKAFIDEALANLGRGKAHIARIETTGGSSRPAPPASPPPPTPATWAPDPYGRADLRYWDGIRWTEHVVKSGQQSVDPAG